MTSVARAGPLRRGTAVSVGRFTVRKLPTPVWLVAMWAVSDATRAQVMNDGGAGLAMVEVAGATWKADG